MKYGILVAVLLLAGCADSNSTIDGGSPATGGGNSPGAGGSSADRFVSVDGDDANDGSEQAPWRHLQQAIDRLQPGERLRVVPGVYEELIVIGAEDSGTEQGVKEILAEPGAIIDGSNRTPQGTQALIEVDGAAWIRIRGFELRNFRTADGYSISDTPIGLLIHNGAHDLEIEQMDIHHIENRSSCALDDGCGQGANGIAVYGDTPRAVHDLRFVGNRVHDNVLSSSEAFTINGNVDGFELIDNEVCDNNNIAFDFIGYETDVCSACSEEQNRARNGIVRGNRALRNSSLGNPAYGGATEGSAGGFYVDGGHHILFENNLSSGNDLGFELASEHPGKASEQLILRNNVLRWNLQAGLAMGGYARSDSGAGGGQARDLNVHFNTFYHNRGWGNEVTLAYRVQDLDFSNNLVVGTGAVGDLIDTQSNGDYRINWGRNLWWSNDLSGSGNLPGDALIEDPLLVDAGGDDFTPGAGSPAIDAAEALGTVNWSGEFWQARYPGGIALTPTSDHAGRPRPQGEVADLGALERP